MFIKRVHYCGLFVNNCDWFGIVFVIVHA